MIVMKPRRQWINFARYSSPPIGKGRILHCEIQDDNLVMDMTLDGVRFIGTLHQVKEEEE
tara:strand:+ start:1685 stop:1864 length:180 start_codon:yes stop_codon:yes gene_type:complete